MIKVLQIVGGMDRGGIETLLMNIFRNIDRKNIQFDFLMLDRKKEYAYEKEIKELGGNIYKITPRNINKKKYNEEFKTIVKQYSIVHIHTASAKCIYEVMLCKKMKVKIINIHSHSSNIVDKKKRWQHLCCKPFLGIMRVNRFACSRQAGEWLFGKRQVEIIKNGIATQKFQFNQKDRDDIRKQMNAENKIIVLNVGRLCAVKNQIFLINLFCKLTKIHEEIILWIVGEGEKKEELEKKVMENGLQDKVQLIGVREDVHKLMSAADIFAFPSLYEGLPLTLLEAQAAGLPCIISNTISKEAIISDLVFACELNSEKIWMDKFNEIIQQKSKREKNTEEIKKSGYDIISVAKQLQEIYRIQNNKIEGISL